jgi:hypothetical protein
MIDSLRLDIENTAR